MKHTINTRALETRFEAISSLRDARIKVLDGTDLAKLLDKNLPELANKIVGQQNVCNFAMLKTLSNIDLKNALNSPSLREISQIYCDLDFAVGKTTSRLFFSFDFKPQKKQVTVTKHEWLRLAEISKSCEQVLGIKFLKDELDKVEQKLAAILVINKKIVNQIDKLEDDVDSLGIELLIDTIIDNAQSEPSDNIADIAFEMVERKTKYNDSTKKNYSQYYTDTINSISQIISNKSEVDSDYLLALLAKFSVAQTEFKRLLTRINNANSKLKEETVNITLDGTSLANKLKEKQSYLKKMFSGLEHSTTTIEDTLRIVKECFAILKEADSVLSHNIIADVLGISIDQVYRPINSMERIAVSVHKLFQTRTNFILYGEAGAGKSTTLQTYARKLINDSAEGLVYYTPLSKAFNNVVLQDVDDIDYCSKLIEVINNYIGSLGISLDSATISSQLEAGQCVLILDGIDEVIEKVPWITKGVTAVSTRYPKSQMLLSSRFSVNYIDQIPFFSLTLLPFTDHQRHRFISQWLDDESKVIQLEQHLVENPELNEIVRNPLLATLLCSLAEHNAPLPDTEIKIYEERMNLLLGLYDIHKKSIRVTSHSSDLWKVARKTAYILQAYEMRHAKKDFILSELHERLDGKVQANTIRVAFSELIDPCNILVPMTGDGQLGFGHLRFQEYLAACELQANRGVSPRHFMRKPSWKGALVLFSIMTDDIEDIIAQ